MRTIYDVSMKHAQNLNIIPTRPLHKTKNKKKTVDTRFSRIMLSWAFQPKPEPNILTGNVAFEGLSYSNVPQLSSKSNVHEFDLGDGDFSANFMSNPPKMKQHVYRIPS